MRRRYDVLETVPMERCPESKVTDELASDRSLRLHPILFAADECQVMFEHPEHGAEFIEIFTDLVKRGPAVAIMVWLATQRPDAGSIPTGISANAVLRLCLKVQGQTENDMVLGTSMYKAGIRATMFSRSDKGIAYLAGEGDDPVIVRTSYVDAPAADAIATRARAARVAANRLTGQAAGLDDLPEPDEATDTILDHLIGCWPATTDGPPERKVWCHTLAGRLAEHWPALYHGWEAKQVTAAVAPYGLRTTQVKRTIDGRSVNNNGLDHAAVHKALTQPETRRQPRQNGGAN
jgi:S-DNA-T family DNA segregation ATPase FtsK/SpoIIIE